MANLLDNFTGTSGTNLTAHTGDSGNTWSSDTGNTLTIVLDAQSPTAACYVSGSPSANTYYVSNWVPASANYNVSCKYKLYSNLSNQIGVWGRLTGSSQSTTSGYQARYNQSNGKVELQVATNNSFTVLGQTLYTLVDGDIITLTMSGSSIGLQVNGTYTNGVSPVTDATYSAAGAAGLTMYNGSGSGLSGVTGLHISQIQAGVFAATSYTLTGPSSGYAGNASTNFTVTPNGSAGATTIFTPSDSSAGGTFTPTTVTITSGSSTAQTFTYTPAVGHDAAVTISCTNNQSLTNPGNLTYTSLIPLTVSSPTNETSNQTNAVLTLTGTGTTWSTNAPSWSITSGPIGTSIVSHSVTNNTSMTITIDTGSPAGTATFTNATDNVTFTIPVGPTTLQGRSVNTSVLNTGLVGTIGYTLVNPSNGTVYANRTTSGIYEVVAGSGIYAASITVPIGLSLTLIWDTGGTSPVYYNDDIDPVFLGPQGLDGIVVEPVTGMNARQSHAIVAAAVAGVLSGQGTTTITIKAAGDSTTTRIVATVGSTGRSAVTLTLPT